MTGPEGPLPIGHKRKGPTGAGSGTFGTSAYGAANIKIFKFMHKREGMDLKYRTAGGTGYTWQKQVAGGAAYSSVAYHWERGTYLTHSEIKLAIKMKIMGPVKVRQDKYILDMWRTFFQPLIPVRSGHLSSVILSTLRIERHAYGSSRYWIQCMYDYPLYGKYARPTYIRNPQHRPPAKGYGQYIGINTQRPPPNVHIIHTTAGGNALYALNDPTALPDVRLLMNRYMHTYMIRDMEKIFKNTFLEVLL